MIQKTLSDLNGKLRAVWTRYRLPVLLLLAGIVLISFPARSTTQVKSITQDAELSFDLAATQKRLAEVLQTVEGAGRVELMLTLSAGPETIYQTNDRRVSSESGLTAEKDTVLLSQSGAEKSPVVVQMRYPRFQGALVVCDGADSPSVRLSIVEAVSSLTGLASAHISVIKMKQ